MTAATSPENPLPSAPHSHPEAPVRHSYPLAAAGTGFMAAFNLGLRTLPYMGIRLGVYVAFTLAAILWIAFCGWLAILFSGDSGEGGGGGLILFIIGIALPAGLFFFLRRYVLYILKLGQIAVITELITKGKLPDGVNQVSYGKQIITEKFTQTNLLFVLDSLITGVVRAFNRTLDWLDNLIPIPGLDALMGVVKAIVRMATSFIDETIFSYNLARKDPNVWRSSADGLVYYGQNAKAVLGTAVKAVLLEYALTFVVFLLCLIPGVAVAAVLPDSVGWVGFIVAILLAMAIKASFLHPIFMTMVALTFHHQVQGQEINADASDHLHTASDKFRELAGKSKQWLADNAGKLQPQPASASATQTPPTDTPPPATGTTRA